MWHMWSVSISFFGVGVHLSGTATVRPTRDHGPMSRTCHGGDSARRRAHTPPGGPGMTTPQADTTPAELDMTLERAATALPLLAGFTPEERAVLLRTIAEVLDAAADELVPLAMAEAHYPEARCRGELARTTFQL